MATLRTGEGADARVQISSNLGVPPVWLARDHFAG